MLHILSSFHFSPYTIMAFLGGLACLAAQYFNFSQAGFHRWSMVRILVLTALSIWVGVDACVLPGALKNALVLRLPPDQWFGDLSLNAYCLMISASLCFCLGCRLLKFDIPRTCSTAIPALAVLFAFGRSGCSLAGCCYGVPVHFTFLGLTFERFPTAQLEAFFFFMLFACLQIFIKKRRVMISVLAYAVFRFFNEFFRGDDRGTLIPGSNLSPAQTISLALLAFTLGLALYNHLKKNRMGRVTVPNLGTGVKKGGVHA